MTAPLLGPAVVIDLGTQTAGVAVVTDPTGAGPGAGTWVVPDPTSRESRWRCALHWDGQRVSVGAMAEHRRRTEPAGYVAGFKPGLELDMPVLLGARRFRPVEQVAEFVAAMRAEAQQQHGQAGALFPGEAESWRPDRALVTIPTHWAPGDPRRVRLLAAVELAGFGAVELLAEAVAAVSAPWPGPGFGSGDFVLVYDLGATFEATVVRIGTDYDEVLGHAYIEDWAGRDLPNMVDLTLAGCRDLLERLDLRPDELSAVLPVGGAARTPGLGLALERGLGLAIRQIEEPELAVLRGAAHWLPRSGGRTIVAAPPADRLVPLSFQIPGGTAQLLRWLVPTRQPYDEGAGLARVRLTGGGVWELTARTPGTLAQVLVGDGGAVRSGDWLALARH